MYLKFQRTDEPGLLKNEITFERFQEMSLGSATWGAMSLLKDTQGNTHEYEHRVSFITLGGSEKL